ncbi:hypothetical protein N9N28_13985 [Rubripirellula amarantea]|nr:hypothetical protein [Rubripirellula amarantea]
MLVICWFGGEFVAGLIAGIFHAIQNGPDAAFGVGIYAFAIFGALLGAAFTFFVVHLLPANVSEPLGSSASDDPFATNPYAPRRVSGDPNNPYSPQ